MTHLQRSKFILSQKTSFFHGLCRADSVCKTIADGGQAHGPGEKAVAGDHLLRLGDRGRGGELLRLLALLLPGEPAQHQVGVLHLGDRAHLVPPPVDDVADIEAQQEGYQLGDGRVVEAVFVKRLLHPLSALLIRLGRFTSIDRSWSSRGGIPPRAHEADRVVQLIVDLHDVVEEQEEQGHPEQPPRDHHPPAWSPQVHHPLASESAPRALLLPLFLPPLDYLGNPVKH